MDFSIPENYARDVEDFKVFLKEKLMPNLSGWYRDGAVPRSFHEAMAEAGWFGFEMKEGRLVKPPALKAALVGEQIAMISPGVAVATLAHVDLGLMGLWVCGSEELQHKYGEPGVRARTLLCLGNTETGAGTDVANVSTRAERVEGGWVLSGTKAYVTNGLISDFGLFTAVTDPGAPRGGRLSMFVVDLNSEGVERRKLNKQVWIPSDLTRVQFSRVFVPEDHLLGELGRGLQHVLTIFTYSRVAISTLSLATAVAAFEMAIEHAGRREVLGQKIIDFQAKTFEVADFYARMEAARSMIWRACWAMDEGKDFRLESSMAKYLSVAVARDVTTWAADLFGAASTIFEHPIHKFPMDAWASSLGEGTQDVQKLIIFRQLMKKYGQ